MRLILSMILGLFATSSFAVTVSSVTITGADCDASNTSVTFSPDNSTFSILYGSMDVTTQGMSRYNGMGQLSAPTRRCRVVIGFRPSPGTQLELQQIDYRAFVSAPTARSFGTIESNHRFIGGSVVMGAGRMPSENLRQGVVMVKQGPFQDDVLWSARYSPNSRFQNLGLHVSTCSGTADLQIETTVKGYTSDIDHDVSVVLDSADGRLGGQSATYKIVENPCDRLNQSATRVCRARSGCPQDVRR